MKIPARSTTNFIKNPSVSCVLLYGPDQGLVIERSNDLRTNILGEGLPDPFCYSELTVSIISNDPSVLVDEAAALSFTGGRRVIRISNSTDGLTAAIAKVLSSREQISNLDDSLIIVESGDLGPRSTLRQLFEKSKSGATIPCYAEDINQVKNFAENFLKKLGHITETSALNWIAQTISGDRAILRNELEKLSLFVGKGAAVTLESAESCLGDSSKIELEDAALAAITGDKKTLDRILGRYFKAGQSPITVLRILNRTLVRLHFAAGLIESGQGAEAAIKALKPPVFWKSTPFYQSALRKWSVTNLGDAIEMLSQAESDCKTSGIPDQSLVWRTALRIASAARAAY